jgi:hypothetical protein
MTNIFTASKYRGYAKPAADEREQAELERRARQQAEAIDAEFEVVAAVAPKLPREIEGKG